MPRLHPGRTDGGPGKTRDRAVVRGARAHEGARHRDHLHLSSPRRSRHDRRPLHHLARRAGGGGEPARCLFRPRSRRRHDRTRGAGHCRGSARARRSSAASPAGRSRRPCRACPRDRGAGRSAWQRQRPHHPRPVRGDERTAADQARRPRAPPEESNRRHRRGHWHGAGRTLARSGHEFSPSATTFYCPTSTRSRAWAGSIVARAIGSWPS